MCLEIIEYMQVDFKIEAQTGRTIELPEEIFGAEPNNHVIYLL